MEIYLDNAATTKMCKESVNAALECMTENYGNPSSLHSKGLDAQLVVDGVRKVIAKTLAVDPACIYFTSGATESNNLAILGCAAAFRKRKPKIVTTTIEHPSVARVMDSLEEKGCEVVRIAPNKNGKINHEDIVEAVDDKTFLVSMMLVNNETGYVLPVRRAFYGIKKKFPKCLTHCDAVQGYMKVPVKASELNADLISISSHKVHGGKGAGALYVEKNVKIKSLMLGGGQEKGLRSGTENVPSIAAFGEAVRSLERTVAQRYNDTDKLRNKLVERLSKIKGVVVNSDDDCIPYIVNFSIPGIRSEIMLHFLEKKGIFVSSGSACSKGHKSGVLAQFGIDDELADSAIRVSMSRYTTMPDLKTFAENIEYGMEVIRRKNQRSKQKAAESDETVKAPEEGQKEEKE